MFEIYQKKRDIGLTIYSEGEMKVKVKRDICRIIKVVRWKREFRRQTNFVLTYIVGIIHPKFHNIKNHINKRYKVVSCCKHISAFCNRNLEILFVSQLTLTVLVIYAKRLKRTFEWLQISE